MMRFTARIPKWERYLNWKQQGYVIRLSRSPAQVHHYFLSRNLGPKPFANVFAKGRTNGKLYLVMGRSAKSAKKTCAA